MKCLAIVVSAITLLCALCSCVTFDSSGSHILASGQLTKIDGRALTLTTVVHGEHWDKVVYFTRATFFSRAGLSEFSLRQKDLKIGQVVCAVYPPGPGEVTRLTVVADQGVSGNVTKINGMSVVITSTIEGVPTETVVICNGGTKFSHGTGWLGKGEMKFEDLKIGQEVFACYNPPDNAAVKVVVADGLPTRNVQ